MKYAFMSFSTPELSLEETLALARQLGFDGIEPRLDAKHAHGIEVAADRSQRERVGRMVLDSGVKLACLATSCRYANREVSEENIADTHERIDLAGDVGAPCMRVFGGEYLEDMTRQQAIEQLAGSLGKVADHAAERGVTLCLETHDAWCDPRHVAEVMQRVNHEAVRVNWDIAHPVHTGLATLEECFKILKPWIRHLHIHDGAVGESKWGFVPIGEGIIDHKLMIELMGTIPFDGYASGEWIRWEPYETALPRELATLKRYEQELG